MTYRRWTPTRVLLVVVWVLDVFLVGYNVGYLVWQP